ncbi:MAG: GIY-YIG nuclease family protein [Candidatus Marinimicrobia bacterium]|nr:GIY-YIG nuclease family protein [Candidatus Neomarinimicrobiota bacterium]
MSRVRVPSLAQIRSYFTYILQSEIDQSFYIGYTVNTYNRLEEHNNGKSKYDGFVKRGKYVILERSEESP